jgi:hypothetical protein
MPIDWAQVSMRVRGLLGVTDTKQLSNIAERLTVSEHGLRSVVERRSREVDLNALAAIVRVYGLDPSWVLTGQYDRATHRESLEGDSERIAAILQRVRSNVTLGRESPTDTGRI